MNGTFEVTLNGWAANLTETDTHCPNQRIDGLFETWSRVWTRYLYTTIDLIGCDTQTTRCMATPRSHTRHEKCVAFPFFAPLTKSA